ncbi:FKBP-type peptidyl-prolyl cis-trans isomerase [Candidatus Kaiserbacteria bacterium]|nr:FKBP-type peptidyl-prolyl cis-trans isomerase [Candidatus Kaiserbacteria bacterium]
MQPTQTGIAVALALAVVIMFFILPGLSPFRGPQQVDQSQALPTDAQQTVPNTMPTENVTQLQVIDKTVGTGATAEAGDTVTVHYVGALTNGTVFDASRNRGAEGFTFALGAGQVIRGWDEGVAGMKEGGKRQLIVPASLAYGDQAVGGVIPANSTLIFEVELLKVQKPAR